MAIREWISKKKDSIFTSNEEKKEKYILGQLGMNTTHTLSPVEEQQLFADMQRNMVRTKNFEQQARSIIHNKMQVSTYINRDLRALKELLSKDMFPVKIGEGSGQYVATLSSKIIEMEASSHRYSQLINMFSTILMQEFQIIEQELNIESRYYNGKMPNEERAMAQQMRELIALLQDVGRLSAGNLATIQSAKISEHARQGLLDIVHLRNIVENYHTLALKEQLISTRAKNILEHYRGDFNKMKSAKSKLLHIEQELSSAERIQRGGVRHGYYTTGNLFAAIGLIGMFSSIGLIVVSGLGLVGIAGAGISTIGTAFGVGNAAFFNGFISAADVITK